LLRKEDWSFLILIILIIFSYEDVLY
jgi:hypothetical protein